MKNASVCPYFSPYPHTLTFISLYNHLIISKKKKR